MVERWQLDKIQRILLQSMCRSASAIAFVINSFYGSSLE